MELRSKIRHYAQRVAIGLLIGLCAYDVVVYASNVLSFTVQAIITIASMVLLILALVGMHFHVRKLCEPCLLHMPLDCAGKAKKNVSHLMLVHRLDRHRKLYIGAVIACVIVLFFVGGIPGLIFGIAFKLSGAEVIHASALHKQLQPWCPECGERGIEILDRTPDPVTTGSL